MKTAYDIIVKPVISERSASDAAEGRYTFVVAKDANKVEIRKAVETLFQVKVLKVNTANYIGKNKRMGVHYGKRADWKKAIVIIDLDPQEEQRLTKGGKLTATGIKYKNVIEEFGFAQ